MKFDRLVEIARAIMPSNFRHYHVTFILKGNRILAIGANNPFKTHPRNLNHTYKDRYGKEISNFVGTHSELRALLKFERVGLDASRCRLVNIRIGKSGGLMIAKPCVGCDSLLKEYGFRSVSYSTGKDNFETL